MLLEGKALDQKNNEVADEKLAISDEEHRSTERDTGNEDGG